MLNQRNKVTTEPAETPVKQRKEASEPKAKAVKAAAPAKAKKAVAKKSTGIRPAKVVVTAAPAIAQMEIAHQDIARLAYLLWEQRGCVGGSPEEDWLKAEALLRSGSMAVS